MALHSKQSCLSQIRMNFSFLFIAADQSRVMQEQMTGAAMAMPADTNKAFKVRYFHLHLFAVNLQDCRLCITPPLPLASKGIVLDSCS